MWKRHYIENYTENYIENCIENYIENYIEKVKRTGHEFDVFENCRNSSLVFKNGLAGY